MYHIRGFLDLSDLSGEYDKEELRKVLTLALEKSPDLNYFDNFLEGKDEKGRLLSGSQLLTLLDKKI